MIKLVKYVLQFEQMGQGTKQHPFSYRDVFGIKTLKDIARY